MSWATGFFNVFRNSLKGSELLDGFLAECKGKNKVCANMKVDMGKEGVGGGEKWEEDKRASYEEGEKGEG